MRNFLQGLIGLMETGRFEDALSQLQDQGKNTVDPDTLDTIKLTEADIRIFQGKFDLSSQLLTEIMTRYNQLNNYNMLYLSILRAGLEHRMGHINTAEEILQDVPDELVAIHAGEEYQDHAKLITRYFHTFGNIYTLKGNLTEAIASFLAALNLRQELGDTKGVSSSLNKLATIYRQTGQIEESLKYVKQSLALEREMGNKQAEGVTLSNMGTILREMGDYQQAIDTFEDSLKLLEVNQNPYLFLKTEFELFLTAVNIDRDLAQPSYNRVQDSIFQSDLSTYIRRLADALWLKSSNRGRDKYMAQEKLHNLAFSDVVDINLSILSLLHLLELLMHEYQTYHQAEVFNEIEQAMKRLDEFENRVDSNHLLIELYQIEAKFRVTKNRIKEAYELYDKAIDLAELHHLYHLRERAEQAKAELTHELQEMKDIVDKSADIIEKERIEEMGDYVQYIARQINIKG